MGDLNSCKGSKKKVLKEWIEEEGLQDIGKEEHTHEWGNHKCRIDWVLTRGLGKPWWSKEGWECGSNHTIIAAKVDMNAKVVERKQIDWDKVRQWLAEQEEGEGVGEEREWEYIGEASTY